MNTLQFTYLIDSVIASRYNRQTFDGFVVVLDFVTFASIIFALNVDCAPEWAIYCSCLQDVFADVKDDEDDFEVVPLKPPRTDDDFSDSSCCRTSTIFTVHENIVLSLWFKLYPC